MAPMPAAVGAAAHTHHSLRAARTSRPRVECGCGHRYDAVRATQQSVSFCILVHVHMRGKPSNTPAHILFRAARWRVSA